MNTYKKFPIQGRLLEEPIVVVDVRMENSCSKQAFLYTRHGIVLDDVSRHTANSLKIRGNTVKFTV
jgi:hypothetical protein